MADKTCEIVIQYNLKTLLLIAVKYDTVFIPSRHKQVKLSIRSVISSTGKHANLAIPRPISKCSNRSWRICFNNTCIVNFSNDDTIRQRSNATIQVCLHCGIIFDSNNDPLYLIDATRIVFAAIIDRIEIDRSCRSSVVTYHVYDAAAKTIGTEILEKL